jgi:serine/threonine protein kinase
MKDDAGRCAVDAAPAPLRALILQRLFLLGRYDVKAGLSEHQSDTCVVRLAVDRGVDPPVPVALKFMRAREHFTREVTTGEAHNLSADHVLELLRSHDGDAEPALLEEAPAHGFSAEHRYCVVLPAAERTLHDVIAHEHVAGRQWSLIASIVRQLGEAMAHLHSKGLIHEDCKPFNIVRCRGGYRLIDLDACVEVGQPAGVKYSSGFVPPEMVELLPITGGEQAITNCPPAAGLGSPMRTGSGRVRSPAVPTGADAGAASGVAATPAFSDGNVAASPSVDMWGLGVTLYALCADQPLWLMSSDGSVDTETLATTASWEAGDVGAELKRRKLAAIVDPQARNLVSQLLSRNPQHRPSIARILAHPFVSGRPAARLPGQDPAFDIFLSYRVASDTAHVEKLYDLLTARGLRVWWDARCLEPGRDWEEGFSEGLAASATIACVLSPGACENLLTLAPDSRCDNVLLEHRLALELQSMGMLGAVTPVLLNAASPAAAAGGAGSPTAAGTFSGRYFPPTARLPECAVTQVEAKVASHLQRLCLGAPLHDGLGVRATMARLMQLQSFLLTPEPEPVEIALARAADVLERAARRARGELTREMQDTDSRYPSAGAGLARAARTIARDFALLVARELPTRNRPMSLVGSAREPTETDLASSLRPAPELAVDSCVMCIGGSMEWVALSRSGSGFLTMRLFEGGYGQPPSACKRRT